MPQFVTDIIEPEDEDFTSFDLFIFLNMRLCFLRLSASLDSHYWPCLLKRFRILILLDPASFSNFHSYNGGSVHSLSLSLRLISDVRGQRNEGKESFSSQQWRCHQCLFGFIGKPSIVPNKTTYTADSFRNCFLILRIDQSSHLWNIFSFI
jgi:hypothetical protein